MQCALKDTHMPLTIKFIEINELFSIYLFFHFDMYFILVSLYFQFKGEDFAFQIISQV